MSFSNKKITQNDLDEAGVGGPGGEGSVEELADIGDVSVTGVQANQVLKYDGEGWSNAFVVFSEITNKPTTVAGYGITDAATRVAVPAGPGANGAVGQYSADANYAYFCVAVNTWIRVEKDATWV